MRQNEKFNIFGRETVSFNFNHDFVKGEIYSFINENGTKELGECISYDRKTQLVKLKKI